LKGRIGKVSQRQQSRLGARGTTKYGSLEFHDAPVARCSRRGRLR
jgi:hypothetical protein